MEVTVFDLETTGLRPDTDQVIEIGAVRCDGQSAVDRFHSLVRPTRVVPDEVLRLTGIALSDLQAAPCLEGVLPEFLKFIAGRDLAA